MTTTIRKIRLRQEDTPDTFLELSIVADQGTAVQRLFQCKLQTYKLDQTQADVEEMLGQPNQVLDQVEKIFVDTLAEKLGQGYEEDTDSNNAAAEQDHYVSGASQVDDLRQRLTKAKRISDIRLQTRLIWHIGELKLTALASDIEACIDPENDLLNYCIAWSLGRLQQTRSLKALEQLRKSSQSEMVVRIAFEAVLSIVKDRQKAQLIKEISALLPDSVQMAVKEKKARDESSLLDEQLDALLKTQGVGVYDLFYSLYLVALVSENARRILLGALKKIPLTANFFKALRQLYKMAEYRFDAEVYALIAYRLETTISPYGKNAWEYEFIRLPESYEYVSFVQEIEKADCRLAYSAKSREYLRRRTWRFVRKLVSTAAQAYVEFASAMLLPYKDSDAVKEHVSTVTDWRPEEDGRWKKVVVEQKKYSAYSTYYAFNQILYAKSQRFKAAPSGRAWLDAHDSAQADTEAFNGDFRGQTRLEAFPELWDKRPDLLLKLLIESECEPVHRFASVALFENQDFCASLSEASLQTLLKCKYPVTAAFALEVVMQRYAKSDSAAIIGTLLDSPYLPAREYGIDKFNKFASRLMNPPQIFSILINPYADVREWGLRLLIKLPLDKNGSSQLMNFLFEYLLALESNKGQASKAITVDISAVLNKVLSPYLKTVEMRVVEQLLFHPLSSVQAVAGEVLIHHSVSAEFLPVKVFHALIESKADNVREVGLKLFRQLPKPVLISQAEMLASFCLSEHIEIRNTVRKVLMPLASETPELGVKLVSLLLNQLFSEPRFEGFTQYILALVYNDLGQSLVNTDKQTILRLLHADNRAVHRLGAKLLKQSAGSDFDAAQWADLASHSLYDVRSWAWQAFEDNVDQVKGHAYDAIRLLDSDWEETRQFAMRFFLNYFKESDWTPDILISICDNERKEIQKYGCELILDFLQEGQGIDYLMKLSQHPSLEMQEFTLNFLNQNAAGQVKRIEALLPYFRSVLSRIGQGRKLKTKVYLFLHQQICKSEEIARLVAPLLNSFLSTCVRTDKERIIEILNDMLRYFPDIETPLSRSINSTSVDQVKQRPTHAI